MTARAPIPPAATLPPRRSAARAPFARGPAVTGGAPHVRAPWSAGAVHRRFLLALLPCALIGVFASGLSANERLIAGGTPGWRAALLTRIGLGIRPEDALDCLVHGLLLLAPLLAVALATGALWERLFARLRGRARVPGLALTAALFTLVLPPELPLWMAAVGVTFGVVIGKEIFGGTGMHVVHPTVVGVAFLLYAYPAAMADPAGIDAERALLQLAAAGGPEALVDDGLTWWRAFVGLAPGAGGDGSALGALLGAVWLLFARVASWRVMLGAALGLAAGALAIPPGLGEAAIPLPWQLALGSFAFGAVFLATDASSSAATNPGRWLHGLLLGFLVAAIRVANPQHPDGTIPALLFASVFAPLLDALVLRVHLWRRARRTGATP